MERYLRSTSVRSPLRSAFADLRRALPFFLLGAVVLASMPSRAAASSAIQDITFQTSGQSLWGSGPEFTLTYSNFWGASWNGSNSGGVSTDVRTPDVTLGDCNISCTTIPGVDLGIFGIGGSVSSAGTFGLRPHLSVNGGAVSATYPVRFTIQGPASGALLPGDPFTITLTAIPGPAGGGSLSTTSPHARATMDLVVNGWCSGHASAKAFSQSIFDHDLFNFNLPSVDTEIFDSDSQVAQGIGKFASNYALGKLTLGIINANFDDLSITTNSGPQAPTSALHSTGQTKFFDLEVDFSNAITDAAGIPAASNNYSIDVGGGNNASANLQILDAFEELDLKLNQDFQFRPVPKVHLVTSDGQTADLSVGGSATFTFPQPSANGPANAVVITPTYSLGGDLTNTTDLILSPSLNFVPFDAKLSGSVAGHDLGSVDIQPVSEQTLNAGDVTIPLFNQSFPLGGFQSQPGNPLTLNGFVYPLPVLTQVVPQIFRPGHLSDALSQANASQPYLAGSGFVAPPGSHPGTTAQLGGQSLPSNLVSGSSNQLSFSLTQQQQNAEGIFHLTASNPIPGGGVSNAENLYIDGTPPASSASLSGPQNANNHGWYKDAVTATVSSTDAISGVSELDYRVDSGATQSTKNTQLGPNTLQSPALQIAGDGMHSLHYKGADFAGNQESEEVTSVNIDGTPPTVTYTGNAGTYAVNQTVNITCSSADNLSGVFSDTCKPVTGPAYSFPLGVNTFSATATDNAGNVGTGSTSFTVRVTADSLCALVQQFVTDSGVAHSLCVKLQNADDAAGRGDLNAKSGIMAAFVSEVQAQSGKGMTTDQAAILTKLALAL